MTSEIASVEPSLTPTFSDCTNIGGLFIRDRIQCDITYDAGNDDERRNVIDVKKKEAFKKISSRYHFKGKYPKPR